jgi:hypothetical protein
MWTTVLGMERLLVGCECGEEYSTEGAVRQDEKCKVGDEVQKNRSIHRMYSELSVLAEYS